MQVITLINESNVLAIPIKDNGESMVDIRQFPEIIVSENLYCPYQKAVSYIKVRKTIANLLVDATQHLPKGIRFYLEEGHRTLQVQKIVFDDYYQKLKSSYPEWNETKLFNETTKYVAAPMPGAPHSTGGAFDISLITRDGNKLDMGAEMNETPDQNQNRNFTFSPNISAAAKTNREILINALNRVGFVNYPTEWWHWSYGDRYWAFQKKQPFALYNSIEI